MTLRFILGVYVFEALSIGYNLYYNGYELKGLMSLILILIGVVLVLISTISEICKVFKE